MVSVHGIAASLGIPVGDVWRPEGKAASGVGSTAGEALPGRLSHCSHSLGNAAEVWAHRDHQTE